MGTALIEEVQPFLTIVGDMKDVADLVVLECFPRDELVASSINRTSMARVADVTRTFLP